MSATRSSLGVAALWATFCVVLLAAGWLSGGHAPMPAGPALTLLEATAGATDGGAGRPILPRAPCPEAPAADPAAAETGADPEARAARMSQHLGRRAWVAAVPLWPADALRWQRLEPSLRLNPGHAPPYA